MTTELDMCLSTLHKYYDHCKLINFPLSEFWKVPPGIEEETVLSLCYAKCLDGYWDTSGNETVFRIRFSGGVE